jgi:NADPH2:quinone reductase
MAAIQLAKQAGATVISTASSDEKLERLRELGLDHAINYASENFEQRTRELTDGRGADVILDSVGGQNLVDSIGALAYRGTLVSTCSDRPAAACCPAHGAPESSGRPIYDGS